MWGEIGPRYSSGPATLGIVATKTERPSAPQGIHRSERVLAYAAISIAVLSAVCMAIVLIGALAFHVINRTTGIWPAVTVLPAIGFPIAIILILVYVVIGARRRSREAQAAEAPRTSQTTAGTRSRPTAGTTQSDRDNRGRGGSKASVQYKRGTRR